LTSEGTIDLEAEGDLKAVYSGKGPQHIPDKEQLSTIIEALNELFGTSLDEKDQLLFDQFEETWASDPEVVAQARNNEFANFRLVFDRMFLGTIINRMDSNEEIYKQVLDDEIFREALMDLYAARLYQRLRNAS
jgi:hypothetical protein